MEHIQFVYGIKK